METLLRDLRYSLRTLANAPAFAAVAILTLALGIGACTAIFSVVDAILLRPLPFPDQQKIVRVWEQAPDGHRMNLAEPNFNDFRAQNDTFSALAAYQYGDSTVTGGSEPVRITWAQVSSGFFPALGAKPVRGRTFSAEEERVHGAPAIIVSYAYWRRYLGSATNLSKFQLRMEGAIYPIVGVMPQGFDFPPGISAWVPREPDGEDSSRTGHNWRCIGRLRDGITLAEARANLNAIAARIKNQYGKDADLNAAAVVPLVDALVGDVRTALLTLLGAVGLLLLVACTNVAGLLVARSSTRRKEVAVRAALGAGRGSLVRQFLAESFSLSLAGGLLGTLLAIWVIRLLPAVVPANLPRQQGIAVNAPVLLFAIAAVIIVAVSLGLFAAWRATAGDLQEALTASSRASTGGRATQRLRALLVIGEIATTLTILIGAGLLGRSFYRLVSTSPGFRQRNLITMEFAPPNPEGQAFGMDQSAIASQTRLFENIVNAISAIPGIESVGLNGAMPVAAGDDLADGTFLILNGQKPPTAPDEWERFSHNASQTGWALYDVSSEGYFRTMGIPLIRGRMFAQQDGWNSPHVAVISQTLARQRWPNQDPIGQVIDFGNMDGNFKPLTIVGIVGDVRARGLNLPPSPIIYVDYRQRGMNANSSPTILVRSAAPSAQISAATRRIFHNIAPDVPVKLSTFADEMGGWLADRRFLLLLVALFATAALALASIGIYGLVAFSVARRTQEIGIRIALGAHRSDVLRLVLSEGIRLALIGIVIGVAASFAITRLLSSLLFGVKASDPITFAGVAVLLCSIALLASYLPARRAMRLDPNSALRYE